MLDMIFLMHHACCSLLRPNTLLLTQMVTAEFVRKDDVRADKNTSIAVDTTNIATKASLKDLFFKTKMCSSVKTGKPCTDHEECRYAHSDAELRPLPDLSKTVLCKQLEKTGTCTSPTCTFAHSRQELRTSTVSQFKVKLCNFYPKGKCIDGENCRFAHSVTELGDIVKNAPSKSLSSKSATSGKNYNSSTATAILQSLNGENDSSVKPNYNSFFDSAKSNIFRGSVQNADFTSSALRSNINSVSTTAAVTQNNSTYPYKHCIDSNNTKINVNTDETMFLNPSDSNNPLEASMNYAGSSSIFSCPNSGVMMNLNNNSYNTKVIRGVVGYDANNSANNSFLMNNNNTSSRPSSGTYHSNTFAYNNNTLTQRNNIMSSTVQNNSVSNNNLQNGNSTYSNNGNNNTHGIHSTPLSATSASPALLCESSSSSSTAFDTQTQNNVLQQQQYGLQFHEGSDSIESQPPSSLPPGLCTNAAKITSILGAVSSLNNHNLGGLSPSVTTAPPAGAGSPSGCSQSSVDCCSFSPVPHYHQQQQQQQNMQYYANSHNSGSIITPPFPVFDSAFSTSTGSTYIGGGHRHYNNLGSISPFHAPHQNAFSPSAPQSSNYSVWGGQDMKHSFGGFYNNNSGSTGFQQPHIVQSKDFSSSSDSSYLSSSSSPSNTAIMMTTTQSSDKLDDITNKLAQSTGRGLGDSQILGDIERLLDTLE